MKKQQVRKPERAPDGNWETPSPDLLVVLGTFVMAWSLIEATMEVAISKELKLSPLDSSIVTAGMQFSARSNTLLSLLKRDPRQNKKAIEIVNSMKAISDRNDIMHSVIGGTRDIIWFNRRKTQDGYSSKYVRYDIKRLGDLCLKCSDLSTDLMKTMKISKSDYADFFQEAHNQNYGL